MSKMSELSTLLDELITCGNTLAKTAQALKEFYSSTETDAPKSEKSASKASKKKEEAAPEPVKEEAPAKTYTKEEVRGVLSAKANAENGKFKVAVKDIVKKYGNGGSLTNVDAKDYAALVADVEALA